MGLANSGHRVMGMAFEGGHNSSMSAHKPGKRIQAMPGVGSSSNLLYGNYGADPMGKID